MSWEQLLAIGWEAAEYRRLEPELALRACPNDGEPLALGPDGLLFCPFDGWRPDGAPRPPGG